ncbi:MAG: hypothetical protein Harvfovirus78_4 [Harvfovirus sp.]|uniref:Uncharacterized protein n=1 Tax=Harvfovirus sp. TaxID=2487768 RepID=A0A3G5A3W0_9VIRU|nr:MAG: hypothetical protein Harvfovirus78_4 [Harvfovirus sp.]
MKDNYYYYMLYKMKYLELKHNESKQKGGGDLPAGIYDLINIDDLRMMRIEKETLKNTLVKMIPDMKLDYLKGYQLIENSGQRNCGIYISESEHTKLIKCTSSDEVLMYLIIMKGIMNKELPANIIPILFDIHKREIEIESYRQNQFYITMSKETGSISDYVFLKYIPEKIREKYPGKEYMVDIYDLMLPRTMNPKGLRLTDFNIPYVLFVETSDEHLPKLERQLIKQVSEDKKKRDFYNLIDLWGMIIKLSPNEPVKKSFLQVRLTLQKDQSSYIQKMNMIGFSKYQLLNGFKENVMALKKYIFLLKEKFGRALGVDKSDYINFVNNELSNDLANKMRGIRYQIFLIDMYLLEVCGLYQDDRKTDNWLVEVSDTSHNHLNKDGLGVEFNKGQYVYVKIGDPETMTIVSKSDDEINKYRIKIGNEYYELGSKLGQYNFSLFGKQMVNDFFVNYLNKYYKIPKKILDIFSQDYNLKNIIRPNPLQTYKLLVEGLIL